MVFIFNKFCSMTSEIYILLMNNICNCFLVNIIYNSLVVSIKMQESVRYGPVAIIVA